MRCYDVTVDVDAAFDLVFEFCLILVQRSVKTVNMKIPVFRVMTSCIMAEGQRIKRCHFR